jgi:O-antigen ligase
VALLGGALVLPQAEKLPVVVQRAVSFLPGKFDYVAQADAASSTAWRLDMWKRLLPEVPNYLFRGKGWGLDASDFDTGVVMGEAGDPLQSTLLVGNYHNGPLSILIPFGIYGAIAFVWFLAAGLRVLHRNWKFGSPALQSVNALLLAAFVTRTISFFCIFGSLHSDIAGFAGLLGLSVALNGAGASLAQAEQPATGVELNTEYIKA